MPIFPNKNRYINPLWVIYPFPTLVKDIENSHRNYFDFSPKTDSKLNFLIIFISNNRSTFITLSFNEGQSGIYDIIMTYMRVRKAHFPPFFDVIYDI